MMLNEKKAPLCGFNTSEFTYRPFLALRVIS